MGSIVALNKLFFLSVEYIACIWFEINEDFHRLVKILQFLKNNIKNLNPSK